MSVMAMIKQRSCHALLPRPAPSATAADPKPALTVSMRGEGRRCVGRDVEGAEMEFVTDGLVRLGTFRHQRERGLRVLLPDFEIAGGDGEPAERVHVASGLGNSADPVPGDLVKFDLVDCHSFP